MVAVVIKTIFINPADVTIDGAIYFNAMEVVPMYES